MEGEKTKPSPVDNICQGGIGCLSTGLTMGYRVAASGKSRATLLICEYEQQTCYKYTQCLKITGKHVPLSLLHPVVAFSLHPWSVQLHLVNSALPPGTDRITPTRKSHLWHTGTKVCLNIQLRLNDVSLITVKWKCIQPFFNYRVEHYRNAIMRF